MGGIETFLREITQNLDEFQTLLSDGTSVRCDILAERNTNSFESFANNLRFVKKIINWVIKVKENLGISSNCESKKEISPPNMQGNS